MRRTSRSLREASLSSPDNRRPGVTGLPLDALRVNAGYQVRVDARGSVGAAYPVDVQQAVTWLQRQDSFRTATTRRGGGRVQPLWLNSHRDR